MGSMGRRLALVTSVVSVLVLGVPLAGTADGPPSTRAVTVDGFAEDVATVGAQGADAAHMSVRTGTEPYSMAAFEVPRGSQLWFRARELDAGWGSWQHVPVADPHEGPDLDSDEHTADVYTEPAWVGAADQIQIRTRGARPDDVTAHLIDSMGLHRPLPAQVVGAVGNALFASAPADAAVSSPRIVSRAQWGADESLRNGDPRYADQVTFGVFHHTAGGNDYTREESPAIVRAIYYYHTQTRGWDDIGYNLLVDRFGTVYEGRYGGLKKGVIGAHAAGFNTGSFGVSVMGNFQESSMPAAALESLLDVITWQVDNYGIDPDPNRTFEHNDTTIHDVNGHRDVGSTACPGELGYGWISYIRKEVYERLTRPDPAVAIPLQGDWNGDGKDTVGWFQDGRWYLRQPGVGDYGEYSLTYGRAGDVPVVGDWDGDGDDTVGIVRNGRWHLRNSLSGGASEISFTYGRVSKGDLPLVGNWNGGGPDEIGIVRNGRWHLRFSLSGGVSEKVFTYGRISEGDIPLVADWDANGTETPGIVRNGRWHLKNSLSGGVADGTITYGRVADGDVPVVGDWAATGGSGVGVLRTATWYLRNTVSGGVAQVVFTYPQAS